MTNFKKYLFEKNFENAQNVMHNDNDFDIKVSNG